MDQSDLFEQLESATLNRTLANAIYINLHVKKVFGRLCNRLEFQDPAKKRFVLDFGKTDERFLKGERRRIRLPCSAVQCSLLCVELTFSTDLPTNSVPWRKIG